MTTDLAGNDLKELGRQIEKLRKKCGLTIGKLALEAEINTRTVQNVERGKVYKIDKLQKILSVLKTHLVLLDLPENISIQEICNLAEQIALMKKNHYHKVTVDVDRLLVSPEPPDPGR